MLQVLQAYGPFTPDSRWGEMTGMGKGAQTNMTAAALAASEGRTVMKGRGDRLVLQFLPKVWY